jgi:ribosome-associated protein
VSPLRDEDIEISFFKSRGPGGQKKNVTESAVRVRHVPTGIIVVSTSSRSQHRNREMALAELERRLAKRHQRPKPRLKSRPTRASVTRRLEEKGRRSVLKRTRRRPDPAQD